MMQLSRLAASFLVAFQIKGIFGAETTFFGQDNCGSFNKSCDETPNSKQAQEDFLAAISSAEVEGFEDIATGDYKWLGISSFTQAGEVEIISDEGFAVRKGEVSSGQYAFEGDKYLRVKAGGNFHLTLEKPVAAFGFFGVDIGDFEGSVILRTSLNGENAKSYEIPMTLSTEDADGSTLFWGVTDMEMFDKIEFDTSNPGEHQDIFAFDAFTVASIEQLMGSCASVSFVVDRDCKADVPSAEQLYTGDPAKKLRLEGLRGKKSLGPGTFPYSIEAIFDGSKRDRCEGTIVVEDNTAPKILCNGVVKIEDITGQCQGKWDPKARAKDNCDGHLMPDPSLVKELYTTGDIVDFTVTDSSGNFADVCSTRIKVADDSAPVINCPETFTLIATPGECSAEWAADVSVEDNCDDDIEATIDLVGPYRDGDVVTFSAWDSSGNEAKACKTTIIVQDQELPSIDCPEEMTLPAGNGCTASWNPAVNVRDNCDSSLQANFVSTDSLKDGDEVTFAASDLAGNSNVCRTLIKVADKTAPVINCPETMTLIATTGECSAEWAADVSVEDNCDDDIEATIDLVGPYKDGDVVTFSAWDSSGNEAEACKTTIIVQDQELPSIDCPEVITLPAGKGCTASWNPAVNVRDNCDSNLQANFVSTNLLKDGDEVTFTVADLSGNNNECKTKIIVEDRRPPVIKCRRLHRFNTDPNKCSVDWRPRAIVKDNCDKNVQVKASSNGPFHNRNRVTFTAVDESGNAAKKCTTRLVVKDRQSPNISCPDKVVELPADDSCMATWNPDVTVTDNCDKKLKVRASRTGPFGIGEHKVTFTSRDRSKNLAQCTTTIRVVDKTKPLIDCEELVELETDTGICKATWAPSASVRDNCDTSIDFSVTSEGPYADNEEIVFSATDSSGNQGVCTTKFRVVDTEPPLAECFVGVDFDGTSVENQFGAYGYWEVSAWDNCQETVGMHLRDTEGGRFKGEFDAYGTNVEIWQGEQSIIKGYGEVAYVLAGKGKLEVDAFDLEGNRHQVVCFEENIG